MSDITVIMKYLSLQADGGMLPHETLSTLRRVRGMRFDYENEIMLFPLTEHDNLQVALAAIRIIVEPLPRSVIAAVQLSHKRDNPSRIVDYDNISSSEEPIDIQKALEEKAEATDKVLLTKINEKLLKALAPFQREGVLFTVNNNGRALIADEMGLGKLQFFENKSLQRIILPHTLLAFMYLYYLLHCTHPPRILKTS
jgi:hypothetical protein